MRLSRSESSKQKKRDGKEREASVNPAGPAAEGENVTQTSSSTDHGGSVPWAQFSPTTLLPCRQDWPAETAADKAFRLRIVTNNRGTGEENDPDVGQAGLIRGNRLAGAASPPMQRQAIGDGLRPASALRVSRFEAIPTTCFHNVVSEEDEDGDMADCCFSTIIASTGNQIRMTNFARGTEEPSLQDAVVIRPADANANGEGRLDW